MGASTATDKTDREVALGTLREIAQHGVGDDQLQAAVILITSGEAPDYDLGFRVLRAIAQTGGSESLKAAHHLLVHARK